MTLLPHHALKLAVLLAPAMLGTADIRQRHLALAVLFWAIFILFVLTVVMAVNHVYRHATYCCPYCKPKPAAVLRRPHWRAVSAVGRYGGLPLLIAAIIALLTSTALVSEAAPDSAEFNPGESALRTAILWVGLGYISATRHNRINHATATVWRPVTRWLKERGQRLVHRGHWLLVPASAPMAVIAYLPENRLFNFVGAVSFIVLGSGLMLTLHHGMSLCEECVTRFPVHAPQYAQERRWRFAAAHCLLWVAAVPFVGQFALEPFTELGANIATSVVYTLIVAQAFISRFHSSYQPWCPYCNGGGGGGGKEEVPDPTPDHGRPVPAV